LILLTHDSGYEIEVTPKNKKEKKIAKFKAE
jgi:hypothetical protein